MNVRWRFVGLTAAALLGVVLAASLGRWQLHRAAEKEALQAAIEAQSAKPPLGNVVVSRASSPSLLIHQNAVLRGTWASQHTVYLDNRQMQGRVGFFVMTPLLLEGGGAILVQRGWLARDFQNRSQLQAVQTPPGMVEVPGRMAPPPSKLYAPGPEALEAIRQNIDLTAFRSETGLPLLDITLQQTGQASEGLQRNWTAVSLGVDKHYGYAFQWFAIASLIAGIYLWFMVLRPRYFLSSKASNHVP